MIATTPTIAPTTTNPRRRPPTFASARVRKNSATMNIAARPIIRTLRRWTSLGLLGQLVGHEPLEVLVGGDRLLAGKPRGVTRGIQVRRVEAGALQERLLGAGQRDLLLGLDVEGVRLCAVGVGRLPPQLAREQQVLLEPAEDAQVLVDERVVGRQRRLALDLLLGGEVLGARPTPARRSRPGRT